MGGSPAPWGGIQGSQLRAVWQGPRVVPERCGNGARGPCRASGHSLCSRDLSGHHSAVWTPALGLLPIWALPSPHLWPQSQGGALHEGSGQGTASGASRGPLPRLWEPPALARPLLKRLGVSAGLRLPAHPAPRALTGCLFSSLLWAVGGPAGHMADSSKGQGQLAAAAHIASPNPSPPDRQRGGPAATGRGAGRGRARVPGPGEEEPPGNPAAGPGRREPGQVQAGPAGACANGRGYACALGLGGGRGRGTCTLLVSLQIQACPTFR